MGHSRLLRAALIATLVGLSPGVAHAQYFGKNKVHYETLRWAVLETPHVRLHYYAQEESLARKLATVAESVCVEYDARFRVRFRQPVPILFFSAHHLFEQTNATSGMVSEGVGGLTELIKGRVLIPHTGSWARLVWVTRHELTHAYMLEKISQVMHEHHRTNGYMPPLWFTEGLAEYCATHWDADAEGLLQDAVLTGRALPLTRSDAITGSVLMYKEGQSFLMHLAGREGPDKVFDLLDQWWRADDFPTAFRIVYGRSLRDADDDWFESVRRHYYPAVATTTPAPRLARRLTPGGDFNLGVRVFRTSPGDTAFRFCYFAATETGIELRGSEPAGDSARHEVRLLRGGTSPKFESFHLFRNRPATLPSGIVALTSKQGGRDVLYLLDARHRRLLHRIELPNLVAVQQPAIAPDAQSVVFTAQDYSGRADLYRVSWPRERLRLERLTNDDFDDIEPDISPDGRWVTFASDRGSPGGRYTLWRLSLAGGSPEPISRASAGDDRQPVYSPDGRWLVYRSSRAGTYDLWVRPSEPGNELRRATRLEGPAYDPDWLPDGRGLVFVGQHAIEFQVYRMPLDPDSLAIEHERDPPLAAGADSASVSDSTAAVTLLATREPRAPERPHAVAAYDGPARAYQRRLGLDIVSGAFGVAPGFDGAGAAAQIALSDVLGNESIYLFFSNDADRFGNFWDGFQGSVTYLNRAQRLNYGFGVFRLNDVYDVDLDAVLLEKRIGGTALLSYPFNKFFRVDAAMTFRHASEHRLRNGQYVTGDLVTQTLAVVRDNTAWTYAGPVAGTRWFASGSFTRDLNGGQGNYTAAAAELRTYKRVVPRVIAATRMQLQGSSGADAQRYYLGGSWMLPGSYRRQLDGTRSAFVIEELRAPVLRGIVLGIPAAWEIPTVNVAGFASMAWTWSRYGTYQFEDRLGSAGFAIYLGGGVYPSIRWNWAWLTRDYQTFSGRPVSQFLILYDF